MLTITMATLLFVESEWEVDFCSRDTVTLNQTDHQIASKRCVVFSYVSYFLVV